MEFSTRFKVMTGAVSMAVALGGGAAVAANGDPSPDIDLDDVVTLEEVEKPTAVGIGQSVSLVDPDGDSLSTPFDSVDSPDTPESEDSVDSPDSPDSPDSAGRRGQHAVAWQGCRW